MNKVFKVVFNRTTQQWTVASELARGAVKSSSSEVKKPSLIKAASTAALAMVVASASVTAVAFDDLELLARIKAAENQLTTLSEKVDTKADAQTVNDLSDKVNTKADTATVNDLTTTVTALSTKHSTAIETLNTQTLQHTQAISRLDTQVGALDNKVTELSGRMDVLEKDFESGMAANAALSGLFQPYGIGRFNATAAIGGYQSQQAVAVGAGYRFNQNFATKMGVTTSTNGGGTAYNVGVNFEW